MSAFQPRGDSNKITETIDGKKREGTMKRRRPREILDLRGAGIDRGVYSGRHNVSVSSC